MKTLYTPAATCAVTFGISSPANKCTVAPAHSPQLRMLTMPWIWCNGRNRGITSSSVQHQASIRVVIWARIVLWVLTVPFGLLVVPLVNSIMARRPGSISGNSPGASASISPTVSNSMPSDAQSSRSSSGAPACANMRVTLALLR